VPSLASSIELVHGTPVAKKKSGEGTKGGSGGKKLRRRFQSLREKPGAKREVDTSVVKGP